MGICILSRATDIQAACLLALAEGHLQELPQEEAEMQIRIEGILTFDDSVYDFNDRDEREWFKSLLLDSLHQLCCEEVGDAIGDLEIMEADLPWEGK